MSTIHQEINKSVIPYLKKACFHSGEDCDDGVVLFDEKPFCCLGCKTVYNILTENNLTGFYQLNNNAGVSLKGRKDSQYAFLDDEEIINKIIDFTDGNTSKVRFQLPQIHCSSCLYLLENIHKLNEGIRNSAVNFHRKEANIIYDDDGTFAKLFGYLSLALALPVVAYCGKDYWNSAWTGIK